jgi:tetratricopeptide (TPR) repeat protein
MALAAALVGSALGVSAAHADGRGAGKDPAAQPADRARELAKKSADAYRRGDFKDAITYLDEAYAIDPQAVLLYNKARAHEGLGNTDEAIANYARFLEQEPNTRDRGAIEQRLTTLRRQRDERIALEKAKAAHTEQAPAQHVTPPPEPEPRRSVLPYVVAGAGVAGIATGAIFGMMALSRKDDAVGEPVQRTSIDLKDEASSLATVSTISFIVGAALVAAGATWWVLDGKKSPARGGMPLRVGVAPGFVGIGGALP